jgi:hypothetical protein
MKAILSGLLLLTSVSAVDAEMSAREAVSRYQKNDPIVIAFIMGTSMGIESASVYAVLNKEAPLFCEPDQLVLTLPQEMDMLTRFITKFPTLADNHLGMILIGAYAYTFPCPK